MSMKLLIVDDNQGRASSLSESLVGAGLCRAEDIRVARDALSARGALSKEHYDLMILDVMLPLRGNDEPDESVAIGLLIELTETSNLIKPAHVIGLTAFEAAEKAVAPDFRNRAWALVRQNEMNDDWKVTIGNAVSYIKQCAERAVGTGHMTDIMVVSALQSEMEAVKRLPWNWMPDEALDESQFFCRGQLDVQGESFSVVAAVASRMGMVSASVLAAKLVQTFRPRLLVMPGICAGIRGKSELGDVICADMSWNYQSGKHVSTESALSGFLMEPHFIQADAFVTSRIDQLAKDVDFGVRVWKEWQEKRAAPPRLLRGPVASGSAVLADAKVTESIRLQQRKVLGVEMELYGIFLAAEQAAMPKPLVLGLKAVCDFADDEKGDSAQPYAMYTSARFLGEFCRRYVPELRTSR